MVNCIFTFQAVLKSSSRPTSDNMSSSGVPIITDDNESSDEEYNPECSSADEEDEEMEEEIENEEEMEVNNEIFEEENEQQRGIEGTVNVYNIILCEYKCMCM